MADLFPDDLPQAAAPDTLREDAPLADRLRPATLDEVIGQDHLTGPEGAIGRMVAAGRLSSMILWGPPGTGKTTIARLLADSVGMRFESVSAVFSGVADLNCRNDGRPSAPAPAAVGSCAVWAAGSRSR